MNISVYFTHQPFLFSDYVDAYDPDEIIGGQEAKPHEYPWMVNIVQGCAIGHNFYQDTLYIFILKDFSMKECAEEHWLLPGSFSPLFTVPCHLVILNLATTRIRNGKPSLGPTRMFC